MSVKNKKLTGKRLAIFQISGNIKLTRYNAKGIETNNVKKEKMK